MAENVHWGRGFGLKKRQDPRFATGGITETRKVSGRHEQSNMTESGRPLVSGCGGGDIRSQVIG